MKRYGFSAAAAILFLMANQGLAIENLSCENAVLDVVTEQGQGINDEVYGPTPVSGEEAVANVVDGNNDIEDEVIEKVKAVAAGNSKLFYIVDYYSPGGDAADLFIVDPATCSIEDQITFFVE